MITLKQQPAMLRPNVDGMRGFAVALALSMPLWAIMIGMAKMIV